MTSRDERRPAAARRARWRALLRGASHGLLALVALLTVGAAWLASTEAPTNAAHRASADLRSWTVPPFSPVTAPRSFVAVRVLPTGTPVSALTVDDAATGAIEHVVMPAAVRDMAVTSTAVDRSGRIWATLSRGPRCTSDIAGCGPVPASCASEVVRIAPRSGRVTPVLVGSADEIIGDAQPSPNGKLLAYLDATCNRSELDDHIGVRDLATGRSWTIGRGLTVCHALGSLAWSPSGNELAVAFGPSRLAPGTGTKWGYGMCASPAPTELAVVPALHAATGLPGHRVRLDPDCQADALTAVRTGYAAVEACGRALGYRTGPARLVFFDRALDVTSRAPVGGCISTLAELRANPSGSDLIGVFQQWCDPLTIPLPPVTPPRTAVLFTDTGRGPTNVVSAPSGGGTLYSDISW